MLVYGEQDISTVHAFGSLLLRTGCCLVFSCFTINLPSHMIISVASVPKSTVVSSKLIFY